MLIFGYIIFINPDMWKLIPNFPDLKEFLNYVLVTPSIVWALGLGFTLAIKLLSEKDSTLDLKPLVDNDTKVKPAVEKDVQITTPVLDGRSIGTTTPDSGDQLIHLEPTPDAKKGVNPPTTFDGDDETWIYDVITDYSLTLNWENRWEDIRKQLDCTCTLQFIYVGVEGDNGEVLFRIDLTDKSFLDGNVKQYLANFTSKTPPTKLVVWPYEVEKEWLDRIDIKL
jgi:hypothetical protein